MSIKKRYILQVLAYIVFFILILNSNFILNEEENLNEEIYLDGLTYELESNDGQYFVILENNSSKRILKMDFKIINNGKIYNYSMNKNIDAKSKNRIEIKLEDFVKEAIALDLKFDLEKLYYLEGNSIKLAKWRNGELVSEEEVMVVLDNIFKRLVPKISIKGKNHFDFDLYNFTGYEISNYDFYFSIKNEETKKKEATYSISFKDISPNNRVKTEWKPDVKIDPKNIYFEYMTVSFIDEYGIKDKLIYYPYYDLSMRVDNGFVDFYSHE